MTTWGYESNPLNRRLVSGTLLTTLASLLPLSSFTSLGHHFIYQLAILTSHAFVTTGPYAYIRHPSHMALPFAVFWVGAEFHLSRVSTPRVVREVERGLGCSHCYGRDTFCMLAACEEGGGRKPCFEGGVLEGVGGVGGGREA